MDRAWWVRYAGEVGRHFEGVPVSPLAGCPVARYVPFRHFENSGAGAISLAAHLGATRVLMLGYDCQRTGGKAHWHGDHPAGLGNAGSLAKWPAIFEKLASVLVGTEIINCSRDTALACFPRVRLEDAL